MAAFIGISGGAEAKVELNGDQDEALFSKVQVCICLKSMVLIWVQMGAMVVGLGLSTSVCC